MADQKLSEAFNDCINRMAAGQSISECLPHYPQYADVLRPMLEIGKMVEQMQATTFEVSAARARVRTQVSAGVSVRKRPAQQAYNRLVILAASLLIVFTAMLGLAENSLPGDSLYSIKRFTENARSALTGQQFDARRQEEIRSLEALKRPADVEFRGRVEQIEGTRWLIAGLDMEVTAETVIAASATTGDSVHVNARTTEQGGLVVSKITPLDQADVPVIMTATFTPSITPAPNPTAIPATGICTPAVPDGWVGYDVQPGDTVSMLAFVTGASVEELLAVNCLPQSQMIIVGQTLFLPFRPPQSTVSPSAPSDAPLESTQPPVDNSDQANEQPAAPAQQPTRSSAQPTVQPTSKHEYHENGEKEQNDFESEPDDWHFH